MLIPRFTRQGLDAAIAAAVEKALEPKEAVIAATVLRALEPRFDAIDHRFEEMDAKSDQRFKEMEAKWQLHFQAMDAKWDRQFADLSGEFARVHREVVGLRERANDLTESVNGKLAYMARQIADLTDDDDRTIIRGFDDTPPPQP